MTRKVFLLLAGVAAATASLPRASAAEGGPIRVGQVVALTGEGAEAGLYGKYGADLAVEQVNKAGGIKGRKLELVQEDDKTTNPGAVAALQRLLEEKDMPAVIGAIRSTQVQAMLPTVKEAGIPFLMGGTNYGLTHQGIPWVFRLRPHDGFSAKVIAKFVVDELKLKKVAVIHATDAFGTGGRDSVLKALKELQVEPVLVQAYNNGEKDYTAVLTALKQSGANVLITYMPFSTDDGIMAKQLKQLGIKLTWVGSPSLAAVDGRKLAGDALYGTYAIADFHPEGSAKSKEFAAAYRAKHRVEPDFYAAWSFDAVLVLAEAMRRAPDLKPESIRKALLGIQGFAGAEGEYNFDENGDGLDHYHIVKNDAGTIRYVKTLRVPR